MTEQDIVAADGTVKGAGTIDKLAQLWATKMTESFNELSREMPVFADLRNIMDLTVVATLITQERLAERAGLDLGGFERTNRSDRAGIAQPYRNRSIHSAVSSAVAMAGLSRHRAALISTRLRW